MTEQVLQTGLERIGTLAADKDAASKGSCWMLGCETLDRDFADFQEYKNYIPALGIPLIRLQAGWAKTEKTKGVYDFSWLDRIVNDAKELGLRCLLETDYGNSIYEGGGGTDLSGGFPSTEEAWNAWDAWVTNLVLHFKDRVHEWAMWNEPDNRREVTAEEIASLNIRTAKIIRKHQPDAFIAGLSLARSDAEGFHYCLSQIREQGGEDLFDSYIYHGYRYNPDDASENGLRIKNMMKQYGFKGVLWQGENGCPSEETQRFALGHYPWTELTQAKWDLRRFIGDYCMDVFSSVFTVCDFNHIGRQINRKGLLMADENHKVIRPKLAYGAIINMTTLFNDGLEQIPGGCAARYLTRMHASAFERKSDGAHQVVYWDRSGIPGDGDFMGRADIIINGFKLKNPVLIDPISGAVYKIHDDNICECGGRTLFLDVPCGDSPLVLADRAMIALA